ncbi:MAG: hypothetical protein FWH04_01400 [Oscillospiraceae bacterium]|nr:hypothetical protein [Oscillospiraceae bacterium]
MPFKRPAVPSDTEYPFSLTEKENNQLAAPYKKISEYKRIQITPDGGTVLMLAIETTPEEKGQIIKGLSQCAYDLAMDVHRRKRHRADTVATPHIKEAD